MSDKPGTDLNPRTKHYEFLGPLGALFITVGVPATTYALYFGCSEATGCPPPLDTLWPTTVAAVSNPDWWKSLWDPEAAAMYFAWYAFCVVAWFVLPGDWIDGTLLRDGTRKKYKINGMWLDASPEVKLNRVSAFQTFLLSMGVTAGLIWQFGAQSFTFIYQRWIGFATAALVMSVVQGLYCYISSFMGRKLLALGGNTGNPIYDVSRPVHIRRLCYLSKFAVLYRS